MSQIEVVSIPLCVLSTVLTGSQWHFQLSKGFQSSSTESFPSWIYSIRGKSTREGMWKQHYPVKLLFNSTLWSYGPGSPGWEARCGLTHPVVLLQAGQIIIRGSSHFPLEAPPSFLWAPPSPWTPWLQEWWSFCYCTSLPNPKPLHLHFDMQITLSKMCLLCVLVCLVTDTLKCV